MLTLVVFPQPRVFSWSSDFRGLWLVSVLCVARVGPWRGPAVPCKVNIKFLFEFNSYFWNHGWLILGTPFFRNPSACNVARISGTNILSFALETICCFSPGWSFVICCLRYHGKISKWWCSLLGENTRLRFFPLFLKKKMIIQTYQLIKSIN